jgi:hypothetical protein
MDKNKDRFQEQDAPLKNTDHAFVRVNKDGTPSISKTVEKGKDKKKEPEEGSKKNQ